MAIDRVAFEFDPIAETGIRVPESVLEEALQEVADFIKTEVLSFVGDGKSPVQGGKWKKKLNEDYLEVKDDFSSVNFANMELTGDMLDALEVVVKGRRKLALQIEGDQAPKADGHNNHSGESKLPAREFIPKKSQTLRPEIWAGVREILEQYSQDEGDET